MGYNGYMIPVHHAILVLVIHAHTVPLECAVQWHI